MTYDGLIATRYWLVLDNDNEPINLLRVHAPDGYTEIDVWYQNEWLNTGLTQAELDGLGGSAEHRLIRKSDEARLVPKFKKNLNYT